MSYTGSIAGDHMVEVAKDGDPAKGSWVVPEASTRDFDPKWFVERKDPETGVSAAGALRAGRLRLPALGPRPAAQRLLLHARGADPLRGHAVPRRAARPTDDPGRGDPRPAGLRAGAGLRARSSSRRSTSSPTQYLTRRQEELGRRIDPEAVPGASCRRSRPTSPCTTATASTSTPPPSSWPRSRCGSTPCTPACARRGSACTCAAATR